MSSSRSLSRCVVTLETSSRGGTAEELFGQRIDAAAERVEALIDDLEQGGRAFVNPGDATFLQARVAVHQSGNETCRVALICSPPLTASELEQLGQQVMVLLSELPDITPRGVQAIEWQASDADTDPGEPPLVRPGDVETRAHASRVRREEAPTRPQGVIAARARTSTPVDSDGADEVTDPHGGVPKNELPTRPEGVIAIRRTPPDKA